jgi:N-acyl-D-amino-acid deacylase
VLRVGADADITVFDPATIAEQGTYANPHQYATGISYVFVNGQLVVDQGEHTGALAGKVLRRG